LTKAFTSLDDWRQDGHYFAHRGQRVFYKHAQAGTKPTLLLIHGFPTSSWDWSLLWKHLALHFNLIALDMIGYGFSAKPIDYVYSVFDQADLCESLLKRLHISQFHLLTHDVGDTVAQELLARQYDTSADANAANSAQPKLLSLCLLNGGLFPETHRPLLVERLLLSPLGALIAKRIKRANFQKNMCAIFGLNTPPTKREIDVMWALINENNGLIVMPALIGYIRERQRNRARWVGALVHAGGDSIHRPIPVRLIVGEADPISGRHMTSRYRALVAAADIMLLNGIGHYPQIEAPDMVLKGYLDFMHTVQPLARA